MKIWKVEINIYNYEFDETEFMFFLTKESATKWINDYKKFPNVSTRINDPEQVEFKYIKDIMTIEQFEELFDVNIEDTHFLKG